jgi:hypothetical protein
MSESALLISTRRRVVWTVDEHKLFLRVARNIAVHGDKLLLRCGKATCPDQAIVIHQDATDPSGAVLRCGCTDRVMEPAGMRKH